MEWAETNKNGQMLIMRGAEKGGKREGGKRIFAAGEA